MSFLSDIERSSVPAHVAIVMDGNGRWAQQRGLPRTEGHGAGEEALCDTVKGAIEVGVRWLTVYAFSTENWKRPAAEVLYLMNFNRDLLRRRRDELNDMNVRIRWTGRRDWRVPRSVLKEMRISEELTRDNTGMTLTIAFNYGGRAEIVDAVKDLARDARAGTLSREKVTEREIAQRLYHPDMPEPDLLIRTGGGERVSNFLLWEAGLRRAVVHAGVLAGLHPRDLVRGDPRLPEANPPLRGDRRGLGAPALPAPPGFRGPPGVYPRYRIRYAIVSSLRMIPGHTGNEILKDSTGRRRTSSQVRYPSLPLTRVVTLRW